MRMTVSLSVASMVLVSCGGGGGDASSATDIPLAAKAMDLAIKSGLSGLGPTVPMLPSNFVFIMNPGHALAQGLTLTPDTSAPGAPPHSVLFSGAFDGNGDGHKGTRIAGQASFESDPAQAWTKLNGSAQMDIDVPLLGRLYRGNLSYSASGGEVSVSGTGNLTLAAAGINATVTVPAGAPLHIKPATGSSGGIANACGYSLSGAVQLDVQSPAGQMKSTWNFSHDRADAQIQNATYLDGSGRSLPLPDSSTTLACGGSASSVADWTGTYLQDWACLPRESGQAKLSLSPNGSNGITIMDEDPPGSGNTKVYSATIVGSSARTVSGFFMAGTASQPYREDFTWTLADDGSFAQFSVWKFTSASAPSGVCVGKARRVP